MSNGVTHHFAFLVFCWLRGQVLWLHIAKVVFFGSNVPFAYSANALGGQRLALAWVSFNIDEVATPLSNLCPTPNMTLCLGIIIIITVTATAIAGITHVAGFKLLCADF
jgi:hypothetical protein